MGEEKKNGQKTNGLGNNDIPPSPFVDKKMGEELLRKLKDYSDYTTTPEIPTRQGDNASVFTQKRNHSESVISQMRKSSKSADDSESTLKKETRALVRTQTPSDVTEVEDSVMLPGEELRDVPRDDGYDIAKVFGVSETRQEDDVSEEEESYVKEDNFVATKEFSKLKSEFFSCLPKIILCVLFALATFIYENFELLGIKNTVFIRIASDVRISALAGIQMTLFAITITAKEMWYGLRSLVRFRAQPESFLPFVALFLLIYQFAALFTGYSEFVPFNFVLFTACILCLVSKWSDFSRKLYALKIVSSKSVKFALVTMKKGESAPEREATMGIMDLSEDAKYIRVVRSKKIVGYKPRTEGRLLYKRLSGVFIVAALVVAAVTFIVTEKSGTFVESLRAAFSVVMFVTPLSIYTVFSFPLYKVSKRAYKNGTAVIGDAASIEYSAPAFVTFNDTDVFADNNVWLHKVSMKDSESFSKGLAYASVVFEPISGPLNKVFAGAADYEVTNETVEYIDISDDGLEAVVNRERVRIGQASYFTKYGYMLEDDSQGNYRIMYVEIGDVIALKVNIVYNIDKDFEKILQNLYKSGMGVVIRTSDPNINVRMIESIIGTGRFPIKVLKYRTESEKDVARDTVDSGIVSKNKVRPMLETLYRCDRAGTIIKSGLLLEVIAFVIGVISVTVLGTLGALSGLTSIYLVLYHLFWSALVFFLTFLFV